MVKIDINDFTLVREGLASVACRRPCSVYSVMLSRAEISDVYFGDSLSELSHTLPECSFISEVAVDSRTACMKFVYLKLSGIYADAEILFNGKSYGRAHNFNRTYVFDISDSIHEGINTLKIKCKNPLRKKTLLDSKGEAQTGYELAPYVPDMGVMGDCLILATDNVIVNRVGIAQRHENGKVSVDISVDTLGKCDDVRAVATLTSPAGKMYFGGLSNLEGSVVVSDPQLWWPRGLGSPSLYKLTVTLYCNDTLEDVYEINIGLREVELRREEDSDTVRIYINGCGFMPLGATYVREDAILPLINKERADRFISSAAEANMNTLRILGEGLYPDSYLYDLCDRYGIMVWQDIAVRYVKPPVANEFASGITNELRDIMSRVSHHASMTLLYLVTYAREGNDYPVNESAVYEFTDVCYRIAEPIAKRFAGDIPFIKNPKTLEDTDESSLENGIRLIHDACFASLPPLASVKRFAREEDLNLLSPVIESHAKCPDSIMKMLLNMASTHRYPYDFESLIYTSQISAGYSALRSVTKARLADSHTSGAVFRQLNDSWPGISSASVDYYGRRKALHYYSKRAFEPIFASAVTNGTAAAFGISNETPKSLDCSFVYALYDKNDKCLYEKKLAVRAEPFSRVSVDKHDFGHIIGSSLSDYYLLCELKSEKRMIYRTIVLFVPPKRFDFKKPNIKAEIEGEGNSFEILLSSDSLALGVEVSFDSLDCDMSDNYLSLTSDFYVKINVKTSRTITREELAEKLRIRSVYDIGKAQII